MVILAYVKLLRHKLVDDTNAKFVDLQQVIVLGSISTTTLFDIILYVGTN